MSKYGWGESLRLFVPQMDEEHRRLLEAAGRFRDAAEADAPKRELEALLAAFLDCTASHFASEEWLMQANFYSLYGAHKAEHDRLLAQVQIVREEFRNGQIDPSEAVSLFLEVWTRQHILGPDKAFARFLNAAPEAATTQDTARRVAV